MGDKRDGKDISRIILCGAQSAGKSTLMGDVMPYLQVEHGGDVCRTILQKRGWTAEFIDPAHYPDRFEDLQVQVLTRQKELDQTFIQNGQDYMSDRGLDALAYGAVYLGDAVKDKLVNSELGQYCINRMKKSLIFLITPHKEIAQNDSVRLTPHHPTMLRFTDVMRNLMREHNIPFEEVTILDRQQRVAQVLDKIKSECPSVIKQD